MFLYAGHDWCVSIASILSTTPRIATKFVLSVVVLVYGCTTLHIISAICFTHGIILAWNVRKTVYTVVIRIYIRTGHKNNILNIKKVYRNEQRTKIVLLRAL